METSESGPPTQIPLTTGRLVPTVLNTRLLLWAPLGYKKNRVETHIHVSRPSFSYPLSLPFWNHAFENPIHIRVLFPVEMDQTKRVKDYATNTYQHYQIIFFLKQLLLHQSN